MHPSATFIPVAHSNDFEFNRDRVVVRRRKGKVEHVGALRSLTPTQDEQLHPEGAVYFDEAGGGFWLVPERHVKDIKAADVTQMKLLKPTTKAGG